ncbi:MAG: hypothetical protein KF789_05170 [Bdellovibrionaceae bacterium]|nr:hypothetical protein [Pseudobdellovibrionaceae bacterium]
MALLRTLVILLLIPSMVFSQSEQVSTPTFDDAGGVRSETQTESQTAIDDQTTSGPNLDAPDGWSQALADQNKPKTVTPTTTTTTTSTDSDSGNGGMAALITGALGICGALLGGNVLGGKNKENSEGLSYAMDEYNDSQGFQKQEDFYSDPELGASIAANYPAGCENRFIDKQGNLGPWGRTALQEIRANPEEYVNNNPPDVMILCKNYKNFDKNKKEHFWVWMFSSLAAPESSCNEKAANHGAPNGTAIGLFQLEKPFCDRVGVSGNLYNGHINTRCAVKGLAMELRRRDNLMSPTSKASDPRRTYWGPLRTDDNNKARGGDISGAKKFRALVGKFPGCGR